MRRFWWLVFVVTDLRRARRARRHTEGDADV